MPGCAGGDAPDLQEFLEAVEKHRQQVVDQLVKTYRTIGPLLGKVEEAVAGTNTGGAQLGLQRLQRLLHCALHDLHGAARQLTPAHWQAAGGPLQLLLPRCRRHRP